MKLMQQVRGVFRRLRYAKATETAYSNWIRRFLKFHEYQRHPSEMGAEEVKAFLDHLAQVENVSASTQNQALNAIVFL